MYLARVLRPACLSSRHNCTPFHLPIALQPSTQSWRVICVRGGSARNCASENCIGVFTRPSTFSAQFLKSLRASAWYTGFCGLLVPLLRNFGDRSASVNSCAIDLRGSSALCAALLALSPADRIFGNHSVSLSRSQPVSSRAEKPPSARRNRL